MTPKLDQRTATAWHEAGHVIVHLEFKLPFNRVHLEAGENQLGKVEYAPVSFSPTNLTDADRIALEHRTIRNFAGPVAESFVTNRLQWKHGSQDFEDALVFALMLHRGTGEHDVIAFLQYCWRRTHNLLARQDRWFGVKLIAEALLTKGELTEVECHKLVSSNYDRLLIQESLADESVDQCIARGRDPVYQWLMRQRLPSLRTDSQNRMRTFAA